VVASQRAPAREVPDDAGVEQLTQGVHVPWQRRRSCCLIAGRWPPDCCRVRLVLFFVTIPRRSWRILD
jgi:hypothetical protein